MENTSRDILFQIGIELDLPDLLRLCKSNKQINTKLCQQDAIWNYKLKKDFNEYLDFSENASQYPIFFEIYQKNKKEYYIFLYKLNKIKTVWKLKYTLYELYYLQILDLNNGSIESIPKEISHLHNLQILYLHNNYIKEIPKEIGMLHNLQFLSLYNNKIENIQKEIHQLQNLQELYLSHNQIREIPKEIGMLNNLQFLSLSYNQIENIPKEIGQLHNLQGLYLSDNLIKNKKEVRRWIKEQIPNITISL